MDCVVYKQPYKHVKCGTQHAIFNNVEAGSLTSRCSCSCSCVLAPHSEQDDKGIQVDTQDLGYETSGRSETEVEREEGSSTGRQERIGRTNSLFLFHSMCGESSKSSISYLLNRLYQSCIFCHFKFILAIHRHLFMLKMCCWLCVPEKACAVFHIPRLVCYVTGEQLDNGKKLLLTKLGENKIKI